MSTSPASDATDRSHPEPVRLKLSAWAYRTRFKTSFRLKIYKGLWASFKVFFVSKAMPELRSEMRSSVFLHLGDGAGETGMFL